MNNAKILLIGILTSATIGGVIASKSKDLSVFYYYTASSYRSTLVDKSCPIWPGVCTVNINGTIFQLYEWHSGAYRPMKEV